jgi:hypothetical protein
MIDMEGYIDGLPVESLQETEFDRIPLGMVRKAAEILY